VPTRPGGLVGGIAEDGRLADDDPGERERDRAEFQRR
jgi:hypothetical protein